MEENNLDNFSVQDKQEYIKNRIYRKKTNNYLKIYLIFLFLILNFLFGWFLRLNTKNDINKEKEVFNNVFDYDKLHNKFNEIISILNDKYINSSEIDYEKMLDGAIYGMVEALEDPYTLYFNEELTEAFEESLSGSFSGIGAEVGIKDDLITIVSSLPNTPAKKAGILPGDVIMKIDGEDTYDMTLDHAVSKIRGEKGTKVLLTIYRDSEELDIEIKRDIINIDSVTFEKKDNVGIINLITFNDKTTDSFTKIVKNIKNDPEINSIILDLRGNPGGYLHTSIDIASFWIENGIVVTEKGKDNSKTIHTAFGDPVLKDYPTIVLINQGSASASEIVAGALKDHKKAILVGNKTFGKGSVQEYAYLNDNNTSLKITVAKWFTPSDINIDEEGISPDFEVDYTLEDFNSNVDPQLNKAFEILNSKNIFDYKE
ncbi:S41 family peptidase [bacterium]|nr:S41 family peptidase [bacterium]